ncbi:zinc finger BED domain-containing protein 4 [Halichoeres trimaculatus]|uniref:zinc finger BED domain-containing protein 4 n=1 Tax=Halichoeres trimaculatus TaxID=147232 RepID=UPI003D9F1631
MLALTNLPLSFVDSVGFRRFMKVVEPKYDVPSRTTKVRTVIPEVHYSVKKHVSSLLCNAPFISFTTDIWSSSVSAVSLISQTARWIDADFQPHSIMLHAKEFSGSHTGQANAEKFEEMFNTWNIPKEAVHVVLRDNAKNIIKGMDEAELPSLPCVAHTLQLTVNEGLLAQKAVSDAVAIGRKIVGYFQHSPLAYSKLQDIQTDMHKPVKRLAQNVPTRWNGTLYLMRSLIEQKQAIGVYRTENKLRLSVNQWSLFEKAIKLLEPFEELTRQVSSTDSSAADVIPAITTLLRVLEEDCEEDRGVGSMNHTLLQVARRRFADIERNSLYSFASILDPRYKGCYFSEESAAREAKTMLVQELQQTFDAEPQADAEEPPAQKPRREQPSSSSCLNRMLAEIAEGRASSSHCTRRSAPLIAAAMQLETYLAENLLERDANPLKYWTEEREKFSSLAKLARKYLLAPCSSVESERLFSSVAHILDDTRNRLVTVST